MTQRVARPMKFAAFISIIISVAVIFAACQGAVGPKGDTGDPGTAGTPGTPGDRGVSQLVALASSPILIDDADDEGIIVVGSRSDVTVASFFRGGKAPVTYSEARQKVDATESAEDTPSQAFDIDVDKDTGAVTFETLTGDAVGGTVAMHYEPGDLFTITATDADDVAISTNVAVRRNRAPAANTTFPTGFSSNAEESARAIGNQDGFAFAASADDKKDVCNQLNTICITAMELLAMFDDTDGDEGITYVSRAKNPDSVTAAMMDGKLVITGHAPIVTNDIVGPARVFIKAVDSNSLESSEERVLWFRVNPGVTQAPGMISSKTVKATNMEELLVADVADFFSSKDAANADETTNAMLVGAANAIIADQTAFTSNFFDVVINNTDDLMITPKNVGSGEVVIRAREGTDDTSQWVTHTIAITVVANAN